MKIVSGVIGVAFSCVLLVVGAGAAHAQSAVNVSAEANCLVTDVGTDSPEDDVVNFTVTNEGDGAVELILATEQLDGTLVHNSEVTLQAGASNRSDYKGIRLRVFHNGSVVASVNADPSALPDCGSTEPGDPGSPSDVPPRFNPPRLDADTFLACRDTIAGVALPGSGSVRNFIPRNGRFIDPNDLFGLGSTLNSARACTNFTGNTYAEVICFGSRTGVPGARDAVRFITGGRSSVC